jgi:hypothetical protein
LFAPFVIGRFCACLPYLEFTRPPAVAVTPRRSNPLSFWIRGDSISAPGAVAQSKPVPVCKYPVNLAQLIGSQDVKQMKFRREFIRAKAAGGATKVSCQQLHRRSWSAADELEIAKPHFGFAHGVEHQVLLRIEGNQQVIGFEVEVFQTAMSLSARHHLRQLR